MFGFPRDRGQPSPNTQGKWTYSEAVEIEALIVGGTPKAREGASGKLSQGPRGGPIAPVYRDISMELRPASDQSRRPNQKANESRVD